MRGPAVNVHCHCGKRIAHATFDGKVATPYGEQLVDGLVPTYKDRARGPGAVTDADIAAAIHWEQELPVAYHLKPFECTLDLLPVSFP